MEKSIYWKNRFIDGLPSLFSERVKKVLRGDQPEIPYDRLTYGKLIGIYTQERLNLCNELKLAQQIKRTQMSTKSQLGDFRTQFEIEGPSSSKPKTGQTEERHHKRRHRSKRYKEKQEEKKAHRKATSFARNFFKRDLKNIKCYKCGRFGHLATNCKADKFKTLGLDEPTQDKLYELLY